MDDLSLRVYLENGSDAMRGGWLELPVVPERLDAFMRGVVGVDDGGGYAVVDHEPGWFGDVLGSDLESFSVSSLNLAARCVAHARDLAVADSVDGDVFLDMLATAAESEDVRFPSGIAALAARAGDVAEFWTEYSLPDSWRAGNSSPDELYGAHVAYGLMGDDAYSSLSYCMDLERLGRDEASNAGVTPGASGFVSDHEPLAPSGPVPDGALDALEAFASGWRPPSAEYRPFDIADIVCEGETVADYTLEGDGTNWGAPVYQCVVDDGFDAGSDVFGVDVLSALEDTLRRIRSARAGMGDFDEVARDFRPGEPVRLFRGVGPERRTLEISNPWDLCRAVKAHNDEYARSRQEAAAMSAEASQARGAAGGADEFDTFGEPADVQDGYLPGDPADPTTMLDPSSGMGATL